MTAAARTRPLAFETIEAAFVAVRQAGMRLSTARRLVLEALFAADGPVSAVHLAHTLSIDESSVYRNLEVLERHGLVRHLHLGHGPGLYVLVADHEVEYLYCEGCAQVTAVTPERLDAVRETIREQLGYQARFTHYAIVGLCERCAAPPSSSAHDNSAMPVGDVHAHHEPSAGRAKDPVGGHAHLHSHGDHVHSHPHAHGAPHDHP